MLTVYNCIVDEHDLRLVILAALVCTLASMAAMNLLHQVLRSRDRLRAFWLGVSAVSIGFGIWATHFIAMLAFSPSLPTAYDGLLTGASLVVAIVLTGFGMWAATAQQKLDNRLAGGALIGCGITAMHFTGMAAFEVPGHLAWDPVLVAAALAAAAGFGAAAVCVGLARSDWRARVCGALLLTVAICSLHFTAMAAVSILPDASVEISQSAATPFWLAVAVAIASFVILVITALALWIDLRDQQRSRLEVTRMQGLADAAVEGLIVCDGQEVATANASFLALADVSAKAIAGRPLATFFPHRAVLDRLEAGLSEVFEAELTLPDGGAVPVELISRPVSYAGRPHVAVAVRDIRQRKANEADIHRLAHHDSLTGLPNRRSFATRLDAELDRMAGQSGKYLALLCLDLDRFKEVNDLFGHAAGDAMLQKVARCASRVLDDGHMLARLGGDEFAVIVPGLAAPASASVVAEAILKALREDSQTAQSDGLASTSIGIAIYPTDASEPEVLLSHADTALYRAKAEGRNTYRFYEPKMGVEARDRRLMEHELRHAMTRGEFHLVYQPQKLLDSGEVVGFEALLRWTHPERGNVSPALFVPIAEENGIIIQIGHWVMETACRAAASWEKPLTIAVNVSAVQLHQTDFARSVETILAKTGLAAHRLEIEITETALVRDMSRALASLRQLKELGVKVAMDDFGTGYSSLSNLRAFPFDKIKIDGSFIRSVDTNEQAATIVRAVLGLGKGLGLPVLAEGVETASELRFLAAEACTIGQGYYLGRPAALETFAEAEPHAADDASRAA
ncbi:diguanylate cyclase [Mesorhizobium sp. L-8-10]|uniref:bifunctional diguanylate cyclase/phosphodiesterase n=1 Tax=Mesorhizobium sp. L-8-10 TaxID=2744523 RepID=UPI0019275333|nr:EAL domain-containing protein [Mesorhizobium sp. L-8-10]BCH33048.1 diguanylate cyclase [Mesorhizobium sp. L-8-10]